MSCASIPNSLLGNQDDAPRRGGDSPTRFCQTQRWVPLPLKNSQPNHSLTVDAILWEAPSNFSIFKRLLQHKEYNKEPTLYAAKCHSFHAASNALLSCVSIDVFRFSAKEIFFEKSD